ncbi:MAG: NUDIX domain-containing protein [Parcubacteria group bacterium]
MENQYLHEVAITAIIIKDGKYLITRRSPNKKRFPGKWTVPGGKMETNDYLALPKDTEFYWYNVLERTLAREVKEEVGLEVKNVEYLTSLATVHEDGAPSLVISCFADYISGEVKLQEGETDAFEWVTTEESKNYDLMDGIYEEFVMIDKIKQGKRESWKRE